MDLSEVDCYVYDQDRRKLELSDSMTDLEALWFPRLFALVNQSLGSYKGLTAVSAADRLQEWVSSHPGFDEVDVREFWFSCTPSCSKSAQENVKTSFGEIVLVKSLSRAL